jgi:hypothetical protein
VNQQGHQDALINRELRINAGDLKRPGDPLVAPFISRQTGDVFSLIKDFSCGRPMISCDEVEIGAFPRPVGADYRVDIALAKVQAHPVDSPKLSKSS